MCSCNNERTPIPIAAGTVLPLRIPVFGQIGKRPIIIIQILNGDGTQTTAPDITTTKTYDSNGFVTSFTVDDADGGGGHAADNLLVDIYPQNIVRI